MKLSLGSALLGLALCGCRASPGPAASVSPLPSDDLFLPDRPTSQATQDLLNPSAPGSVRTVDEPWRSIEGAPSGRVRLLEMYQSAVTQRDKSTARAADLERELHEALARSADAEKQRADLETRNDSLSGELRELHAKALELARRLAQAELSLLKAEKAGLELRASDAARSRSR